MGMFDTIFIQKELPLTVKQKKIFSYIDWEKQPFQTKNLDNALSTYTLKKNGKLYVTVIEGEHVRTMTEVEEKKERKKHRWVWPYEFVEKSRKEIVEKYTGDLLFYDIVSDTNKNEWWVEFEAKIINGSLKGKIKTIKLEINRTHKEIQDDEAKWKKKMDEYNQKLSTKFKKFMNKITCRYWYYFWDFVSKTIRKTSEGLNKISFWVIRNIA
jgi:hypothetical protein